MEDIERNCPFCKMIFHESKIEEHILTDHLQKDENTKKSHRSNSIPVVVLKRINLEKYYQSKSIPKVVLKRINHEKYYQNKMKTDNLTSNSRKSIDETPRPTSSHKCQLCESNFTYKHSLLRHIQDLHKIIIYECEVCKRNFLSKNELAEHVDDYHQDTVLFDCE